MDCVTLDKNSTTSQTPSQLQHYFTIIPAKLRLVAAIAVVQSTSQVGYKIQSKHINYYKHLYYMYIERRKTYHFHVYSTRSKILSCNIQFYNTKWSELNVCIDFVITVCIFVVHLMSLHGEMLQKERNTVYHQFCVSTTGSVLLCTVSTSVDN